MAPKVDQMIIIRPYGQFYAHIRSHIPFAWKETEDSLVTKIDEEGIYIFINHNATNKVHPNYISGFFWTWERKTCSHEVVTGSCKWTLIGFFHLSRPKKQTFIRTSILDLMGYCLPLGYPAQIYSKMLVF